MKKIIPLPRERLSFWVTLFSPSPPHECGGEGWGEEACHVPRGSLLNASSPLPFPLPAAHGEGTLSDVFKRTCQNLRGAPLLLLLALALLVTSCERHEFKKPADVDYYTCTMHPSVRSQEPGKCPICGMTLVPVKNKASAAAPASAAETAPRATEFNIPLNRQQLIGVTYATVETRPLQWAIRTVGVVAADPLRRWSYVSRVEGYVDKLEVSSAGQTVAGGQPLLTLNSPDLLVAERELVDLLQSLDRAKSSNLPAVIENAQQNIAASRQRLRFWNIDDAELDRLEKTRQSVEYLTLFSPFQGIVRVPPSRAGAARDGRRFAR